MSIDVMKQALEYLDSPSAKLWPAGTQHKIITALRTAIEQAEKQGPVACLRVRDGRLWGVSRRESMGHLPDGDHYLYATPPAAQRQPLTDEQIKAVIRAGEYDSMEDFARAIEAAHGIGEKK